AQADVGRILAALCPARDLDQLDGRFVQGGCVDAKAAPVGVRLLGHDFAFFYHPFQDPGDFEAVAPALEAEREVFKVNEDGQRTLVFGHVHLLCAPASCPQVHCGRTSTVVTCSI